MRILQAVPYFYPAWAYGGPGKLVYDTSVYYASQGNEVVVFTSDSYDKNGRMKKRDYVTEVKNLRVFYFRNINNFLAYAYNIFITPGMFVKAIFEIPKIDVIHIHDFYTFQCVWLSFLGAFYRKPYILSVHGCLEEARIRQRSLFKKVFILLFGKTILKNAKYLIATSPNEVIAYEKFEILSRKIILLGHGVDEREFKTTSSKLGSRKYLGLNKDWFLVTFLGRIHKIKGLDLLVEAADLLKDVKKIHFVIAGSDDGYLSTLKKMIVQKKLKDKITLLGTTSGGKKAMLFKATDLFVYPSYSEGFSLGILEMAASGHPLVITKGCHFDLVDKYNAGKVVESDTQAIKSAILYYAKNPKSTEISGKNAARLIEENYTMKRIGDKILSIYRKAQNAD